MEEDLLIVGLGNPGPEYATTRHNLGALCVQELGRRLRTPIDRKRWKSVVGSTLISPGLPGAGERRVWLLLPQTMMNLSGRAVSEALRDVGSSTASVWAVYDELDLPLCRLRIRVGGSAAGHNGVRSLIASLGTDAFVRFRIGVGKPPTARAGAGYVLGKFSKTEAASVPAVVAGVASALQEALASGVERAMDLYNRSGSLGCEEIA